MPGMIAYVAGASISWQQSGVRAVVGCDGSDGHHKLSGLCIRLCVHYLGDVDGREVGVSKKLRCSGCTPLRQMLSCICVMF